MNELILRLPVPGANETVSPKPAVAVPFGPRLFVGIMGVLIAAIMSGLNNRIGAITLIDLRGGLSLGADEAQWITTVYSAGELVAMPVAAWFAVTFSFRRFLLAVVAAFALLAVIMPAAPDLQALLTLRGLQGLCGGALIPLLMTAALRFFPLALRLYGLSLYAMTATFAPNIALWLAPVWTDQIGELRLVYWGILPLAAVSSFAVWWGIPQDPLRLERLRSIDWIGLVSGSAGLAMLAIAMAEGERRDWLNSSLIAFLLGGGVGLMIIFVVSEWFHPLPFVKLQLLGRRNLGLGFTIFVGLLIVMLSGSLLPADQLNHVQGFRMLQVAPIGLAISLPQLILAPLASFLLYRSWVDARHTFALGLLLIAVACWMGSSVTTAWMVREFALAQALQAIGQPLAVVSMLFLATSVVAPPEGPFVSGLVNVLRAFGTLLGSTLVGRILTDATAAHQRALIDRLGRIAVEYEPAQLAERIGHQAFTLAVADAYRILGLLALALIPLTLLLTHIPSPKARNID